MHLERVIAALAPADVLRRAPVEIGDLAYDARAAGPGSLFFCVPGSRADGHDFAAEAVANGAVALVVERPLELDVPQLVVPDARRAMAPAAEAYFGHPSREPEIAGVTGTNGKTTTASWLYSEAKRGLFTETRPAAAINVGDEHGRLLADELRGEQELLTYGFADDAELRPEGLESGPRGARFRAGGIELETRLRGRFNVENVLGAVAAARLLAIPDDAIAYGVKELRGVPGRLQAVDEGQPFAVLVDYPHTPDSPQ